MNRWVWLLLPFIAVSATSSLSAEAKDIFGAIIMAFAFFVCLPAFFNSKKEKNNGN